MEHGPLRSETKEEATMAQAIEMVRFTVKTGHEEALVEGRSAMLLALSTAFPGMVDARLAKLDARTWLDLVVWESREEALAAAAGAVELPIVAAWFENIAEVVTMEHADVVVRYEVG